jgi:hypothetical protein
MSASATALPPPRAEARTSAGWLYGPVPDLLIGCGAGYTALLALLCFYGPAVRAELAPGVLPFLTVLIGAPHYGATLLRVYERREDRRAYALFAVHTTVLLAAAFVVSTRWMLLGSLLLTLYITWSPWHYTGQNYGLAVMFLRRRGVALDARTKRWVYASFVLSYAVVFLAIHSQAPGSQYTPPIYSASGYRTLSLGIPDAFGTPLFDAALGGYLLATAVALLRLLRRGSLRALAPALVLAVTQALWFSIPVTMRRFHLLAGLEPFAPTQAGWYFFWAALGHSMQYVWVTSWFARRAPGFSGTGPYLGKALLAGTAAWGLPALLFAPGVLGRIPYDAGLGALVAAVVNLHHFVLDGAIWKLRDGRIARILLRSEAAPAAAAAATPPRRLAWRPRLVWAAGAASLAAMLVSYYEWDFTFRRALETNNVLDARAALERLEWIGRDSAVGRLQLAKLLSANGEQAAALHEVQDSLQLFPTANAWVTLAQLLEDTGHLPQARAALDRAIAMEPGSSVLAYQGGRLAERAGDLPRARALLERAVALDSDSKLYRFHLDRLLARAPPVSDAVATPAEASR